jgi:hypothetical protein
MSSGTGGSSVDIPVIVIVMLPFDPACMKYQAGFGAELKQAQVTGHEPVHPAST